jgi:hypothetical protein
MTDCLTPIPTPAPTDAAPVVLHGHGKTWGRLFDDGRYLEVTRRGCVVIFDLVESARLGRGVLVRWEDDERD